MKRQVRQGVFETNSSSMHSLTVIKRDERYTSEEILEDFHLCDNRDTGEKNCIWHPWSTDLDFGRTPFRVLGTFEEKWLYACASLVGEYNDKFYKELSAIALKYVPNLKKIELPKKTRGLADKNSEHHKNDDYYQEHGKTEEEFLGYLSQKEKDWGIDLDYCNDDGWWKYEVPYTGYVDEDILSGFLKQEEISLEEFLINKKYVVIQDGDEYLYWRDMKRSGLVDLNIIDHEYPSRDEYGCTEEDNYEEADQA